MTALDNNRTEPLIATYLHQKGAKLGLPISGTFEITNRCNFSCPMCYVHSCKDDKLKKQRELSAAQWISLAEDAKNQGMMFALITGGEPFVRDDFFEIYNAMKAMGLMISINTNGSLLNGENLRRLMENPPFRVNISLYGMSRETYINMCRNDAFEKVKEAIVALKKAGVDVRLSLSLTPYNMQDMKKIHEFSLTHNIHVKCSTYMFPPLRKKDEEFSGEERFTPEKAAEYSLEWDKMRFSSDDFSKRCRNIRDLCEYTEDLCGIEVDDGIRCRAGRSSFWITADGGMLPCGMMTFPRVNILHNDFKTAWEYIRKQSTVLAEPMECRTCPKRKICNHCAAVCVTETGSFDKVPVYMCRYSDALSENAAIIQRGESDGN